MNANATGNYRYIGLIMVISAIVPYIFLGKYGRRKAGITRPQKKNWLLIAFLTGLAVSFLFYLAGKGLFGNSYDNWYVYIGKSYNIPPGIDQKNRAVMFAIMAITGMIFSPVGEELFFRGTVHSAFAASIGERRASFVDSSAFALTHISHFGLVFINGQWSFLAIPALLWVTGIFLTGLMFIRFRKYSGSVLGAITCHAAFNLGMIFCIFYLL